MKPNFAFLFLTSSSLFFSACSNTTPEIGVLNSMSESLDFDSSNIQTSSWENVPITGRCSGLITAIEVSLDGGTTWNDATRASMGSPYCSGGSFSLLLSKGSHTFTIGQTVPVQVRSLSRMGNKIVQQINVTYIREPSSSQRVLLSAGSQSSAGYNMQSRVLTNSSQVSSNASYRMKGRVF